MMHAPTVPGGAQTGSAQRTERSLQQAHRGIGGRDTKSAPYSTSAARPPLTPRAAIRSPQQIGIAIAAIIQNDGYYDQQLE